MEKFRELALDFLRSYKKEENDAILEAGGISNFKGLASWPEDKKSWYEETVDLLLIKRREFGITDKDFDQILFDEGAKFVMVVCPSFLIVTY